MYLGGKGLGLKLIYDRITSGIDPFGEENIITFMTGSLLGTGTPSSSRFSAVPLHKMLDKYYKVMGFDKNGITVPKIMQKLNISYG